VKPACGNATLIVYRDGMSFVNDGDAH
jgi:hypothetical protein